MLRPSKPKEAAMLTPMSIMSLDQGKDLARQHVERLYAEPAQPASETMAADTDASEAPQTGAWLPTLRLAELFRVWAAGYAPGVRRGQNP
jgi:hypothetical protein